MNRQKDYLLRNFNFSVKLFLKKTTTKILQVCLPLSFEVCDNKHMPRFLFVRDDITIVQID